jgi:L-asparaginase II
VREILASAELDEGALKCPVARPIEPGSFAEPTRLAHNCSGKHAAMLATSVTRRWPLESYLSSDHPLQRAVAGRVEELAGAHPVIGVDGCGVPTYAFPLRTLARAFASLASSDLSLQRAAEAMRTHPVYVAGRGRVCTELMQPIPGAVAKVGAEGLGCVLHGDRVACFKVRDGSARAREALMAAIPEIAGMVARIPQALSHFASAPVLGGERQAGQARVIGSLS